MTRYGLDSRRSKGEGRERAPGPPLNLPLRRVGLRFCTGIAFSAVALGSFVLSFALLAQVKITGGFKYPWYEKPGPDRPNRLVTFITGTEAEMLANDVSLVKQMRLEHYPEDGITNLIATAPECLLDAANRTASSTNRIELRTASGLFIEGQGFFCDLTNFNFVISNRVRTLIQQDLTNRLAAPSRAGVGAFPSGQATPAPGSNSLTTIFADHFDLNYASNLITYTGSVRVDNVQLDLSCATLTIQRSTNGAIQRMVAERDVNIVRKLDRSRATGGLAVYTANQENESVELTRDARWEDGQRHGTAEIFIFDLNNNTLRAERNAAMTLPRSEIAQPGWLQGQSAPAAPAKIGAAGTNQFVEITSEVMTIDLPATNRPARTIVARTNVVILSPADQSRAVGELAVYREATSVLELSGNAAWQAGPRQVRGQTLLFDGAKQSFLARQQAYLKLPLASLGAQSFLSAQPLEASTTKSMPPQFLEVSADECEYLSDRLTFRERVRGRFLEADVARGTLDCGFLALHFHSNQVESAVAHEAVRVEQLPWGSAKDRRLARKLDCECLTVQLLTNGQVDRIVAETNVVATQTEWRPGAPGPIQTRLTAGIVTTDFFVHTNQVRQVVAERNVTIVQEHRRAQGDRAVYNGTNNVVELTGHPTAELPEGKITQADVLLWDRAQNKLSGQKLKAQGTLPAAATNRTDLPPPK